ncbi:HGL274Wp [Eremothecium sinecaudum]|uniref:Lysophospholipase NTE1 n=1 Tax=Eremothecium sinecaudum TaxID=45286 RepID=A0A109UXZ4_9SACH|nr:HGL274Wp [Eremothecium sinecaudum]AMD22066.1 HGL274Wp [Eremothecium sinecaudum]
METVGNIILEENLNSTSISTIVLDYVAHFSTSLSFYLFSLLWSLIYVLLFKLPKAVFRMLNQNLPFYLLVIFGALSPLLTHVFLRSRLFSAYSHLKRDPNDDFIAKSQQRIDDEVMFMNQSNTERRSGFTSYLDEFLSAIRIFGYLDKLVFHELTKSMRTQRLEEGEVMLIDDSVGFSIVVEGNLQIYHKVASNGTGPIDTTFPSVADDRTCAGGDNDLRINGEQFQLLNIVKAGNPVSSLVSILKLFTDNQSTNVPSEQAQRISDLEDHQKGPLKTAITPFLDSSVQQYQYELDVKQGRLETNPVLQQAEAARSRSGTPVNSPFRTTPAASLLPEPSGEEPYESLPDIVAYASTDCTIAVIPASAFKRLMVKYPRSATHIIQMILTKLYRVTFQTAHSYLGLTKEIIHTEIVLNNSVNFGLPYYLQEAILRKIKRNSKEYHITEDVQRRRRTKSGNVSNPASSTTRLSRNIALESRDQFHPGDLLSNVPLSRKDSGISTSNASSLCISRATSVKARDLFSPNTTIRPDLGLLSSSMMSSSAISLTEKSSRHGFNDHSSSVSYSFVEQTEESVWRMALVENMFGYLGITNENIMPPAEEELLAPHRRSSSSSFSSSYASMSQAHSLNHGMFKCIIPEKVKVNTKTPRTLNEEMPLDLDFNTAKEEFADGLEVLFIPEGTVVVEQNATSKGLYYIVSGEMNVCTTDEQDQASGKHILYTVKPGGIAGYLASLIGFKSFVTLEAKTNLYVGFLPLAVLEKLCDKYFMIYLRIAETLTSMLSPKILKLDYALEWIHLEASETLFNQNDPANAIYVVLNGRLRQLRSDEKADTTREDKMNSGTKKKHKKDATKRHVHVLGEYSKGHSFGEVEVLTVMNRSSTVVAVRDTELARIPRTLFEVLALEHPSIMIRVTRLVAKEILQQKSHMAEPSNSVNAANGYRYDYNLMIPPTAGSPNWGTDSLNGTISYKTITILPITQEIPVGEFAAKLVSSFRQVGKSTIGLNQSATLSHLGRHAFDKLAHLKQSGFFATLEELYEVVVYIADTPVNSSWTSTCISQGDCILLLADAAGDPEIGEYERLLLKAKTTARTELLLLHPERYVEPGLTNKWLRNRPWVHQHHHMQFVSSHNVSEGVGPKSGSNLLTPASNFMEKLRHTDRFNKLTKKTQENFVKLLPDSIKNTVETLSMKYIQKKQKYYTPVHAHKDDFLRLARILSGQAIGLVLGGGGARGISHLGVLKAIEEHGIPIDMIGGTSFGAYVGGLYAKDYDLVPIYGRVKKFAGRVSSIWRMLSDLTWPITSYTTGHEFNRGIWKSFGDIRIEDFWIQYYCNSTNITESVQEIHSSGYAWRYIRASMSLAGMLPPLTDDGNMLLDGGYLDNLPVSTMKARGCKTIFAVDVGSVDDRTPMEYGDYLNGFWILFNRWNPFSTHPNVPNMAEIQMRLGYVASVNALEKAKNTPGVFYARPPIEGYATLDFSKFEEIYQVGAAYGSVFFEELEKCGRMPKIPGNEQIDGHVMQMLHRRNSI